MFNVECALTCGIKYLEYKFYTFISNQLKKIIYPKGIFVLKYNKDQNQKFVASIISFIYMYLVIFFIITALLSRLESCFIALGPLRNFNVGPAWLLL